MKRFNGRMEQLEVQTFQGPDGMKWKVKVSLKATWQSNTLRLKVAYMLWLKPFCPMWGFYKKIYGFITEWVNFPFTKWWQPVPKSYSYILYIFLSLPSLCHLAPFTLQVKGVFDSSTGAEPIIVNRPVSNFTQRVCKVSTLYMQSRGAPLKKLVPSDYICNLISLVPLR